MPVAIDSGAVSTGRSEWRRNLGFELLAVSTAAVGLASVPAGAEIAYGSVEDDELRVRDDGTDPDANTGVRVPTGSAIVIWGASLGTARFIRVTGDSELQVNYYG